MTSLLLPVSFCLVLGGHWDYNLLGSHGPHHWHGECSTGEAQSPIDLNNPETVSLPAFKFSHYDRPFPFTMVNTGHSFQFLPTGQGHESYISGGGLSSDFILAQGHFHWGNTSTVGSEHLVEGESFPLELHLVHYNAKYKSLGDAVQQKDGLAVLGVMFNIVEEPNLNLEPLLEEVEEVRTSKSEYQCSDLLSINSLLPKDINNFYRYSGSLTTPGCFEVVTWTVFKYTSGISIEQLNKLRTSLHDSDGEVIVNNYRPVQSKNQRNILLVTTEESNADDSAMEEKKIVWYMASVPGWSVLVATLVSSLTVGCLVWLSIKGKGRWRKGHQKVQQDDY